MAFVSCQLHPLYTSLGGNRAVIVYRLSSIIYRPSSRGADPDPGGEAQAEGSMTLDMPVGAGRWAEELERRRSILPVGWWTAKAVTPVLPRRARPVRQVSMMSQPWMADWRAARATPWEAMIRAWPR